MANNQRLAANGLPNGQPIQVESFRSFAINQEQNFNITLAANLKPSDLILTISNQILGLIDRQLNWTDADDGTSKECRVSFRAPIVGVYTIEVELIDRPTRVQFQAKAYDLSKVFIQKSSTKCRVGESYELSVDASDAGEGQLEIAVNEGEIPNQVQLLDNGKCIVNFVPEENIPHVVDIKFNGHNVNGCPFVVEIEDLDEERSQMTASSSQSVTRKTQPSSLDNDRPPPNLVKNDPVLVNSRASFAIENFDSLNDGQKPDDLLLVLDPENHTVEYKTTITESATSKNVIFEFKPSVVGDYAVELNPKSVLTQSLPVDLIEKFPFPLKVFDHKKVLVSYVTDGVIGHPVYFLIDATQAGSGNLEIRVSSKTRNVPNYPEKDPILNAKIRVHFTPTEAVDHSIDVKFNGIPVQGNPFLVRVAQYPQARLPIDSKDKLEYVPIDEFITFFVDYIGSKNNRNPSIHELTDKSCQVYVLKPDSSYAKLSTVQFKMEKDKETNKPTARFKVTFKATKIGPHKFFIVVNNELLPNSPIVSNVFNINEVKVYFDDQEEPQGTPINGVVKRPVGRLNKPVNFIVDASRAGEGTLALYVVSTLSQLPVQTNFKESELRRGLYDLTFVPMEFATHAIDMSFNKRTAPHSPFLVDILNEEGKSSADLEPTAGDLEPRMVQNFSNMSVTGAKPSALRNIAIKNSAIKHGSKSQNKGVVTTTSKKSLAYGLVNASNIVYLETGVLDSGKSSISLLGPAGEKVPFKLGKGVPKAGEPKKPYIEYKPKSIGTHTINVLEGGKDLRQYYVEICDPSLIKIMDLQRGDKFSLGKPISFSIDSHESGQIQLDSITILGPPTKGQNNGAGKQSHSSSATDSSILSRIKSISGSGSIAQASGSPLEYSLNQLTDHEQVVEFTPSSLGRHTIDVRCLGQPVGGSPIEIEILRSSDDEHSDQRSSDQQAAANQARSNGKAVPMSREEELRNSIVVHGISLKCSPVNSTGAFIIETDRQAQARDFDVLITDPGNCLVDVQCYLQQDGNLLAEWTPRRVGTHKIEVYYKDEPVPGSPFISESFDPSGVILENIKSTVYAVNDKIELKINRKQAGNGELDVAINSPLGKDLPIEVTPLTGDQEAGEPGELVSFKPTVAGKYKMSITFAGYEVPKSPITFIVKEAAELNVNGGSNGRPTGLVKLSGSGLKCAEINRSAQFLVESSNDGELKLRIECGDREIVPKIEKRSTGHQAYCYSVKYKPTEVGYTSISLYWQGVAVEGSPFSVPTNDLSKIVLLNEVGKPVAASSSSGGQRMMVHYEAHQVREISVDTAGCGPGNLVAEAYCRANPAIKFSVPIEQISASRHRLLFSCPPPEKSQLARGLSMKEISMEATYLVRFFYNNLVVPETLVSVLISPLADTTAASNTDLGKRSTASKTNEDLVDCPVVALRGHGLADARCDEDAEFTIDGQDAGPGKPEVRFTALSTTNNSSTASASEDPPIDVRIEELDRRCYKVVYRPRLAGTYSLNVLWGGKQVAGCPITISVLGQCEPSKVVCTGEGLKGGVLGDEIKVLIDTRRAGAGELTAMCTGPQKVAFCELLDRGDGTFILYIKPQESGRQTLTVKYGGQHVPKSPFTIKVSGKPDPSKVRVYGPGVEHGVLSLYQSRFVCDTRGAGAGQLTVRIRGPKGAFRMETQRESQRDRTILCKYDPTEPGDYRIEIKWSGRHVPGSPFSVMIFDTQEELNRFLGGSGSQLANKQQQIPPLNSTNLYNHHGSHHQLHPSVVHHNQQQVPYASSMLADYAHHAPYATQQPPFRLQ